MAASGCATMLCPITPVRACALGEESLQKVFGARICVLSVTRDRSCLWS